MAEHKSRGFIGHKLIEGDPEEIYTGPKRTPLSIKIDIDVSNALKGLKAVQREAKEAAKSLREVESINADEGIFHIAIPRTLWADKEEHGIWDMIRDSNGAVMDFSSVTQAQMFAEKPDTEYAGRNYFIVKIHG